MQVVGPKSLPAIGFLTVSEHLEQGLLGGYLVLNAAGRPLEFHCTAPVRANRAQQILYGPTLGPFLYGEQIGQTLLAKAQTEPLLVCTDVEPALAVRDFVSLPVVLVRPRTNSSADDSPAGQSLKTQRLDSSHSGVPTPGFARLSSFTLGAQQLAVLSTHEQDRQQILDRWRPYADALDLQEPFTRIREAIEEAQRSAR
jgi:hypothetical protein